MSTAAATTTTERPSAAQSRRRRSPRASALSCATPWPASSRVRRRRAHARIGTRRGCVAHGCTGRGAGRVAIGSRDAGVAVEVAHAASETARLPAAAPHAAVTRGQLRSCAAGLPPRGSWLVRVAAAAAARCRWCGRWQFPRGGGTGRGRCRAAAAAVGLAWPACAHSNDAGAAAWSARLDARFRLARRALRFSL
jgi:hypothetical protein